MLVLILILDQKNFIFWAIDIHSVPFKNIAMTL